MSGRELDFEEKSSFPGRILTYDASSVARRSCECRPDNNFTNCRCVEPSELLVSQPAVDNTFLGDLLLVCTDFDGCLDENCVTQESTKLGDEVAESAYRQPPEHFVDALED
jgi:hypothetical protein